MFCLKAIFFVAVLTVVNAGVTVNIYGDDGKDVTAVEENLQELHGCTNQACDFLCRLLNFPGGSCVNGGCKCNNRKQTDDVEEELHLKRSLQETHHCNNEACDQLCRRMKFPFGICLNGRCKCDDFKQLEDLVAENVKDLGSCNLRACDQLCRRLGFPGGVCVEDKCKCDNFLQNNNEDLLNMLMTFLQMNWSMQTNAIMLSVRAIARNSVCPQDIATKIDAFVTRKEQDLVAENVKDLGSCNWRACDQLCRRLGFPGGVCVGDKCKCDNFLQNNNEDLLNVNDFSANELENANECNNVECESYCQKLGLPSGYCYQDRCICYKKKEKVEANTLQRCDVVACNEMCHRLNYIGGMCRNGSCYCY